MTGGLVRDILRGGAIVYGLLAAGFSLLAALGLGLMALAGDGASMLMAATISASMVAVGCGLGVPLALAGWHSLQGRPSPLLRLPPIWLCFLVLVACLGIGTLVIHIPAASVLLLPPLHIVASGMPALILIAAILPSLQAGGAGLTRRSAILMLAYGGLVATALAVVLEAAAAMAAMAFAVVAVSVAPAGRSALDELSRQLQSPAVLSDPERLLDVFISPALVLGIGLLVAVVTPLIEETVKSLGAWAEGSFLRRFSRSRAFAFGVIIGCGFALVEALFYASAGLPRVWASSILVRGATTVIHATATGLAALGWYEACRGRLLAALGFLAAGIGLHMAWNGVAGLTAVTALDPLGNSAAAEAFGTALGAFATASLVGLFFAAIAVLVVLTRRLRTDGAIPP